MEKLIKDYLTDIINDYQGNGRDFVNYKYDKHLGMELLFGSSNYIISSSLWDLMSAEYGLRYNDDDFEEFHNDLYYVCCSMGLRIEPLRDDEIPFYIWLEPDEFSCFANSTGA